MSERRPVGIPLRVEPVVELPAAERTAVLESIRQNCQLDGALLPVLHGIQDRLGWVPPRAVPLIAVELNLSRAEVHGVLTFYHYFRQQPPGQKVIYLCRAEACQAVGSAALVRFYVLHCVLVPVVMGFLMAIHFFRVRRDGGVLAKY